MGVTQAIGRVCGSGMLSLLAAISRHIIAGYCYSYNSEAFDLDSSDNLKSVFNNVITMATRGHH